MPISHEPLTNLLILNQIMMKKLTSSLILMSTLLIFSCGEDESCTSNGEFTEGCFEVVVTGYNVQTINTTPPYQRENLQLSYQRPNNGGERISFVVRSDQNGSVPTVDGALILFEEGENYIGSSMIFNGNINAPATGEMSVVLSKVDRTNGLVSGSFVWSGFDTGATTSDLSGSFTDVAVSLEIE